MIARDYLYEIIRKMYEILNPWGQFIRKPHKSLVFQNINRTFATKDKLFIAWVNLHFF